MLRKTKRRKHTDANASKPVLGAKTPRRSVTRRRRLTGADLLYFVEHPDELQRLNDELQQLNEVVAAMQPYLSLFKGAELYRQMASAQQSFQRQPACAICDTLFVPLRRDQKCCSKPCALRLRVRRWRERQARYEQQRKFKEAGIQPEGRKR